MAAMEAASSMKVDLVDVVSLKAVTMEVEVALRGGSNGGGGNGGVVAD